MNKRSKGQEYEEKTKEYLVKAGLEVLNQNYNCKFGEVDLIVKEDNTVCFVEVKYRANGKYGHPSEAVNYYKRRNIVNVSKWYVHENKCYNMGIRYDVAVWHQGELKYYKGAFDYEG